MNNNSIHSLCIINRIVYRSSTQGFPPDIFCFCIIGRGHKMATNYEGAVTIEFATPVEYERGGGGRGAMAPPTFLTEGPGPPQFG